jgi:hypothetical protein
MTLFREEAFDRLRPNGRISGPSRASRHGTPALVPGSLVTATTKVSM